MLTNRDIEKLLKVFASKEDFKELKKDVIDLKESTQVLISSVDKLVKSVSDLRQEYVAITSKISRHEKWIQEVAKKVGVKLEY